MYKWEEKLLHYRWYQWMASNFTLMEWGVILFFMFLLIFSIF